MCSASRASSASACSRSGPSSCWSPDRVSPARASRSASSLRMFSWSSSTRRLTWLGRKSTSSACPEDASFGPARATPRSRAQPLRVAAATWHGACYAEHRGAPPGGVMLQIRQILVPVDFSDHSARALEVAISLAQTFGARIHLLHCYPIQLGGISPYGLVLPESLDREVREAGERRLAEWRDKVRAAGVEVDASVTPVFA